MYHVSPLKFTQLLHGPMAMTTSLGLGLFSDVLKILGNTKTFLTAKFIGCCLIDVNTRTLLFILN